MGKMTMEPIIKTENLTYRYPDEENPAVDGVSLEIPQGSFTAILGHNGSGKSTFAKLLNGILIPSSGRVLVDGMDTSSEEALLKIRQTVGMVFQNPDNQLVASVVEEDVAFAPENLGLPPAEIRRRVDRALKLVDMYEFRLRAPHLLSGGQKQRVAIAGVIAMSPRCIVLDEPTAMLDPAGRGEVIDTIVRLCREQGLTVILITHHMSEAVEADMIYVMNDGKTALSGSPRQVFSQADRLRELGLTVPDGTELLLRLNRRGMELPKDALTPEECALAIKNALDRGKR